MILFLHGPDTYRSTQKLKQIKDKFVKEVDPSKMNLTVFDGDKINIDELKKELSAAPFMADKRLIIIKNALQQKNNNLQEFITTLIEGSSDNIIVIIEEKPLDGRKKNVALLKKSKFAQEFSLLDVNGITHFILSETKLRGGVISQATANYMSSLLDNDLWHVSNEIDKLIGYAKGEEITKEDIDLLVQANVTDDIFKLIDAISTKNKAEALKLLDDQFEVGHNEMYLLSKFIWQFRIMVQIKNLLETNPHLREGDIAKTLGIHPYVAKKSLAHAHRFTMDYLKAVYRYLVSLDKSFKNSYADPKLLLNTFIAKI